jgi:3-oxoacyl-[acyl-carrier protein] reductase
MNELDFAGKQVLVIGGSSGIGNGIAHRFRRHGAAVSVWWTRPSAADYDPADGSDLEGLDYAQVDVSDRATIADFDPNFRCLDVLVQCQGTVLAAGAEYELDAWDRVMALNLDSLLACANKFRRTLAERRGSIIIISSISGFQANSANPAYSASKSAAISLTHTLGRAWIREGIRVNGIAPGFVDTKLTRVARDDEQGMAALLRVLPAGYAGTPDEIGGVALFLASSLSSYVVGQTLIVDGGLTLSRAIDGALGK